MQLRYHKIRYFFDFCAKSYLEEHKNTTNNGGCNY